MINKFRMWRSLSRALLLMALVGVPFLRVHGESAFRFDIPSLRLLFFGTAIGMEDFFIVLIAVIFLTFFTLFATAVYGRIWCGWLCPQTVLMDFASFRGKARTRGLGGIVAVLTGGALTSMVLSASMVGYFVSPYAIPVLIRSGGSPAALIAGSWSVLSLLLFLDIIAVGRRFCATVCPYAKMQGVLFDDRTLIVSFDESRSEECMKCAACVRACPIGIDIRDGTQMACIHCAECVDACRERMAVKNRSSLVNYTFGLPRSRGSGIRVNVMITGAITVASLAFLIYLVVAGTPFDMTVSLNYTGEPSIAMDGSVTNGYLLTFRNKSAKDLQLDLSAVAPLLTVRCTPGTIMLGNNPNLVKVPVSVTIQGLTRAKHRSVQIVLIARSIGLNKRITKSVYFLVPYYIGG
jgi:polyferredoxin